MKPFLATLETHQRNPKKESVTVLAFVACDDVPHAVLVMPTGEIVAVSLNSSRYTLTVERLGGVADE